MFEIIIFGLLLLHDGCVSNVSRHSLFFTNTRNHFLADDEGGNVKPILLNGKSKSSQDELQVRLGFFLENNPRRNLRAPIQSCSSLTSTNTSPVSTLTGSSEADVSRTLQLHQEPNHYNTGCDSIGSMMSVSISEQSNASSSPMSRRHSVTSKCGRSLSRTIT